MEISIHASKRFLERVMNKTSYTYLDVDFSKRYLERLLYDVSPNSCYKYFVIPGFSQYKAIHRDNILVTIIPK